MSEPNPKESTAQGGAGASSAYTEEMIKVLEGIEHVRTRPAMYIGDTTMRGLHHLIWEIVDNSIDEAMAGFCSSVTIKINADGYGSMYYLTTGFHGLHVTGGLIAFIIFMIRTTLSRFTPAQATAAIVVSYYWHFVDIVWIALFAMIYFLK